jgi:hypothetical protein
VQNRLIRSITAFVMLVFFSLSITPRLFLHELFADHQDMVLKEKQHSDFVGKDGFTCDINDLVATSPFTYQYYELEFKQYSPYEKPVAFFVETVFRQVPHFNALRGPPSVG